MDFPPSSLLGISRLGTLEGGRWEVSTNYSLWRLFFGGLWSTSQQGPELPRHQHWNVMTLIALSLLKAWKRTQGATEICHDLKMLKIPCSLHSETHSSWSHRTSPSDVAKNLCLSPWSWWPSNARAPLKDLYDLTNADMGVSKNSGTPKPSILIGFSIINHPFWGTPIFGNTHITPGTQIPQ